MPNGLPCEYRYKGSKNSLKKGVRHGRHLQTTSLPVGPYPLYVLLIPVCSFRADGSVCYSVLWETNVFIALDKIHQVLNTYYTNSDKTSSNSGLFSNSSNITKLDSVPATPDTSVVKAELPDFMQDNVTPDSLGQFEDPGAEDTLEKDVKSTGKDKSESGYRLSVYPGETEAGNDPDLENETKKEVSSKEGLNETNTKIEGKPEIFKKKRKPYRKNLQCKQCGEKCSDSASLKLHKKTHSKFVCTICGTQCPKLSKLDRHMLKEHNQIQEGTQVCTACNLTFRTEKLFAEHMERHKTGLKCIHCPETFPSQKLLKNHQTIKHHRRYCKQCPLTFRNDIQIRVGTFFKNVTL